MRKKSNQKKEKKIRVSEKMGNATPGPGVHKKKLKPAEAVLLCHKKCPIISYLFSYLFRTFWWLRSYCCPMFQFWGHSRYATIEAHNAKSIHCCCPKSPRKSMQIL